TSPMLMNGGTVIFSPGSVIAGLYCAAAGAPLPPRPRSTTHFSPLRRRLLSRGLPPHILGLKGGVFFTDFLLVPTRPRRQRVLVIRLGVHEDVVFPLLVEVLEVFLLQEGDLDLVLRADAVEGDGPRLEVLELELEDGPPIARGVQVPVEALVELPVVADQHHAFADIHVFDRRHNHSPSAGAALAA